MWVPDDQIPIAIVYAQKMVVQPITLNIKSEEGHQHDETTCPHKH
jgi:hypothetical protein